jgi:hypothetical protein
MGDSDAVTWLFRQRQHSEGQDLRYGRAQSEGQLMMATGLSNIESFFKETRRHGKEIKQSSP